MATTSEAARAAGVLTTSAAIERRRALAVGISFLLVAGVIAVLFGLGVDASVDSTFRLNVGQSTVDLPDLAVPSRLTASLLALVCAAIGGVQLTRGFERALPAVVAVVGACFVIAFLTWAAAGASFNLTGMLQSTVLRATPLTLGALSGVLCERSGIVNIAIEGMMLSAAFTGALVASAAGSQLVGLAGAVAIGGLLGLVLAVLSIRYVVDQIIGGTVINIFALGITSFLSAKVFSDYQELNNPGVLRVLRVPLLSHIPVLGPIFFINNLLVFVMLVLVPVLTVALFRTRWGLRVRAVGEHPRAADTVGIDVLKVRYRSVVLGGMVAGLAGAFFTLGSVGRFDENMTAGRGFIALAALIFGRWHPVGAFGAALVFGFAESLQSKLAILSIPIPSEFLLMAPYLVTLLVVAGIVGRSRAPAADGQPYEKG
ncbi:MAG: ABC transporter permease [Acidimicrobiales bacterium]